MVEINKLSVEKALEKMRSSDARQSRSAQFDEKIEALDEGIERMRAQRLRLERNHRKRDQDNP
jgi:TolA-binding protein